MRSFNSPLAFLPANIFLVKLNVNESKLNRYRYVAALLFLSRVNIARCVGWMKNLSPNNWKAGEGEKRKEKLEQNIVSPNREYDWIEPWDRCRWYLQRVERIQNRTFSIGGPAFGIVHFRSPCQTHGMVWHLPNRSSSARSVSSSTLQIDNKHQANGKYCFGRFLNWHLWNSNPSFEHPPIIIGIFLLHASFTRSFGSLGRKHCSLSYGSTTGPNVKNTNFLRSYWHGRKSKFLFVNLQEHG